MKLVSIVKPFTNGKRNGEVICYKSDPKTCNELETKKCNYENGKFVGIQATNGQLTCNCITN